VYLSTYVSNVLLLFGMEVQRDGTSVFPFVSADLDGGSYHQMVVKMVMAAYMFVMGVPYKEEWGTREWEYCCPIDGCGAHLSFAMGGDEPVTLWQAIEHLEQCSFCCVLEDSSVTRKEMGPINLDEFPPFVRQFLLARFLAVVGRPGHDMQMKNVELVRNEWSERFGRFYVLALRSDYLRCMLVSRPVFMTREEDRLMGGDVVNKATSVLVIGSYIRENKIAGATKKS